MLKVGVLLIVWLASLGCVSGRRTSAVAECGGVGPARALTWETVETVPELSPFGDGSNWHLLEKVEWTKGGVRAEVPKGFVTDFASVPAPFRAFLPKWEKYGTPGIIHDYLYRSQHVSRADADRYMLHTMEFMNVPWPKRYLIYGVLRAFGGFAWNGNYKRRIRGEPACIPEGAAPLDARQTWTQCKARIVAGLPCGGG